MDMQPIKSKELIEFLKNQKNVWWIAKLDGAWNFVFAIWVKSNKEFNEFYQEFGLKFRQNRSEEHTSELQSHSFISYAVFCFKKKTSTFTPI